MNCPVHVSSEMQLCKNESRRRRRISGRIDQAESEFGLGAQPYYKCVITGCPRVAKYVVPEVEHKCKRCKGVSDAPEWRVEKYRDHTCTKCLKQKAAQRRPRDLARNRRVSAENTGKNKVVDRKMFRRK